MRAELVDGAKAPRTRLGESPRWDGESWLWVDASAGNVWSQRNDEPAVAVWRAGQRISLVQPEASGRVVVACGQTLDVLDKRADGAWSRVGVWCHLKLGDGWLVNDGVPDSRGQLWIGSIAPLRAPLRGGLLLVRRDGTVQEVATAFTLTNGMAWDADETHLFHVDTLERTIWTHKMDLDAGKLITSERFIDFDGDDGLPDGIATDVDGGVWVAMYNAAHVRRYDAEGSLDLVVEVEPSQCTSVELGGPDGRDMLITTAREGYDDERSAAEPLAGRLYRARSAHPGLTRPKVEVGNIGRHGTYASI